MGRPLEVQNVLRERSIRVPLRPEHVTLAIDLAHSRRGVHCVTHKDNIRLNPATPYYEDIMGCFGEVGVWVWDNRFLVNRDKKPGGDSGFDCIIGDKRVDIKMIGDFERNLIHQVGRVSSDIYLLGVKEPWDNEGIWLLGWCESTLVKEGMQVVLNPRVGKLNHVVSPARLNSIHTLLTSLGLAEERQ